MEEIGTKNTYFTSKNLNANIVAGSSTNCSNPALTNFQLSSILDRRVILARYSIPNLTEMQHQFYSSNQHNPHFHQENLHHHVPYNYYGNGNMGYRHTNYYDERCGYWPDYDGYARAPNPCYNYLVDGYRNRIPDVNRNIEDAPCTTSVYHRSTFHSRKEILPSYRDNAVQRGKNKNAFVKPNKKRSASSVQLRNSKPIGTQSITNKNVKKKCVGNNLKSPEAIENKKKEIVTATNGNFPSNSDKPGNKLTTVKQHPENLISSKENKVKMNSRTIAINCTKKVEESAVRKKEDMTKKPETDSPVTVVTDDTEDNARIKCQLDAVVINDSPVTVVADDKEDNARIKCQPDAVVINLTEETDISAATTEDAYPTKYKKDIPIIDLIDVNENKANIFSDSNTALINLTGEMDDLIVIKKDPESNKSEIIDVIDVADNDDTKMNLQSNTVVINLTGDIEESAASKILHKPIKSQSECPIEDMSDDIKDNTMIDSKINTVADNIIEVAVGHTADIVRSVADAKTTTLEGDFYSSTSNLLIENQSSEENATMLEQKYHEAKNFFEVVKSVHVDRTEYENEGFGNKDEITAELYQHKDYLPIPSERNAEEILVQNSISNNITLNFMEEMSTTVPTGEDTQKPKIKNDFLNQNIHVDFHIEQQNTEERQPQHFKKNFQTNIKIYPEADNKVISNLDKETTDTDNKCIEGNNNYSDKVNRYTNSHNHKANLEYKVLSPGSNKSINTKTELIKLAAYEKDTEFNKNTCEVLVHGKKSTKISTADSQYTKKISLIRKNFEEFKKRVSLFKDETKSHQIQHTNNTSKSNTENLLFNNPYQQIEECKNYSKQELLSLLESNCEIQNNNAEPKGNCEKDNNNVESESNYEIKNNSAESGNNLAVQKDNANHVGQQTQEQEYYQEKEVIQLSKNDPILLSPKNIPIEYTKDTQAYEERRGSSPTKISKMKSRYNQSTIQKQTLLSTVKNSKQYQQNNKHDDDSNGKKSVSTIEPVNDRFQYHEFNTNKNCNIHPKKRSTLSPERTGNCKKRFKGDTEYYKNIHQTRYSNDRESDENTTVYRNSKSRLKRQGYFSNEENDCYNKYRKYQKQSYHEDQDGSYKNNSKDKISYADKRNKCKRATMSRKEYYSDEDNKYNRHSKISNNDKKKIINSRSRSEYYGEKNCKSEYNKYFENSTTSQKYKGSKDYRNKYNSEKLHDSQSSERRSRSSSNNEHETRYEKTYHEKNYFELIESDTGYVTTNIKNDIIKDNDNTRLKNTPTNKTTNNANDKTLKSLICSSVIFNKSSYNKDCAKNTKRTNDGDTDKQDNIEPEVKRPRHSPIKFPESEEDADDIIDLRSKLSTRRNLNNIFTKLYNKQIAGKTIKKEDRSNLIITFENDKDRDELSEKSSEKNSNKSSANKTAKEKKEETIKTKFLKKLKCGKKRKNLKLVIKLVCESSTSSEDEAYEENSANIEDISFLDDLNVDEIIESITDISKDKPNKHDKENIEWNLQSCDSVGSEIDLNLCKINDTHSMLNKRDIKAGAIIKERRCQKTVDEGNTNNQGNEPRIVVIKTLESDHNDIMLLSTNVKTHVNEIIESENINKLEYCDISIKSARTDYKTANSTTALNECKTYEVTENPEERNINKLEDKDIPNITSKPKDDVTTNRITALDNDKSYPHILSNKAGNENELEDVDVISIKSEPIEYETADIVIVLDKDKTDLFTDKSQAKNEHDKPQAIDPEKAKISAPSNAGCTTYTSRYGDRSHETYAFNVNSEINDIKEELTENHECLENICAMINSNNNCELISNNSINKDCVQLSTDVNNCTSKYIEKDVEVSDIKQELTENTESLEKICAMIYGTSNNNYIQNINNIDRNPFHDIQSDINGSDKTVNQTIADFDSATANISQVNLIDANVRHNTQSESSTQVHNRTLTTIRTNETDIRNNNSVNIEQKDNSNISPKTSSSLLKNNEKSYSENKLGAIQETETSNVKTIKVQDSVTQKQDITYLLKEHMQIHLKATYKVEGLMHKGSFSNLYRCKNNGTHYVAKITSETCDSYKTGMLLQKDLPEMNCNCISILHGFVFLNRWCFIMEYYPKNLEQVITKTMVPFHINLIQDLSKQLVDAVLFLKNNNIVHSDIKPTHVLITSNNETLKVGGFDDAYNVDEPSDFLNIGTVNYRAPELIMGHSAGFSIDVWGTALVIYEMATRSKLFVGKQDNNVLYEQMCTLGNMPPRMIEASIYRDIYFAKRSFLKKGANGVVLVSNFNNCGRLYTNLMQTSKRRINGKPLYMEQLKKFELLYEVLENMLQIHPENRWDMNQVAKSDFFMQ